MFSLFELNLVAVVIFRKMVVIVTSAVYRCGMEFQSVRFSPVHRIITSMGNSITNKV